MATAGAIRAGRSYVELFADDSKLVRGLRRASAKLQAFGAAVSNLGMRMVMAGTAGVAAFALAGKTFASVGDRIAKMSLRTGLSAEALSELGYAAERSGTDLETLEVSLRRMAAKLDDAAAGSAEAQETFARLGLEVKDLKRLSPERRFKLIADRLSKVEDMGTRAALAMDLFGRSGTALLPLLEGGSAGIEVLQARARALGLTISSDTARRAAELTDALTDLRRVARQVVVVIGGAIAPAMKAAALWLTQWLAKTIPWIQRNEGLVVSALKLAAGVLAIGAGLVVLGKMIAGAGLALAGLGKAWAILAVAAKVAGAALAVVFGKMLLPLAAIGAGILILTGRVRWGFGVIGRSAGWLGQTFTDLRDTASEAFGGIVAALMSGDFGAAANILWLTLKLAWAKGVSWVTDIWYRGMKYLMETAFGAWAGILASAQYVCYGLEVAWIETVAFLEDAWDGFVHFFKTSWEIMKGAARQTWAFIKGLFDKSVDSEAQKKAIESETKAAVERLKKERAEKGKTVTAARERKRAEADAKHETELGAIGQKYGEWMQNLKKYQDLLGQTEIDQAEADLEAARAALQGAVGQAKGKASAGSHEQAHAAGLAPAVPDWLTKIQGVLERLGEAVEDTVQRVEGPKGTFSAVAASLLGGGSAADRTASATEATAKFCKRLVDETKQGRPAFG